MEYDFQTLVSRKGLGSAKWNVIEDNKDDSEEELIPFSVADMEFKNAPEIIEGLKKYMDSPIYGYTEATKTYYDAVCCWMKKRHDYKIEPEWIVEFSGVVPALHTIVQAITNVNDGVIVMTPVYYPFYKAIKGHGRRIIENKLIYNQGKYSINFEELEQEARKKDTKLIILCNPHNPVGRVWTKDELKKVGEICIRNNVLVVSDEIHFDLIMEGYKHTVFSTISKEFEENSIICTAPSKTFNLAGLQTSNIIIANKKIREIVKIEREKSGIFKLNTFGYKACELAYTKCEAWLDELLKFLNENIKFVEEFFEENIQEVKEIQLEGTYLQWLDFRELESNYVKLQDFMENEAKLFLDEGYIFGKEGQGFERINIACPKYVLEKALNRLLEAVNRIYKK